VEKWKADAVITFDNGGISGHINHKAVSSAIIKYAKTEPEFPPTFVLRTVSTFFPPRKYIGLLDLPFTSIRFIFRILYASIFSPSASKFTKEDVESWHAYDNRGLLVSSFGTWRQNVHAFWAHSSQRSWDRWLYMLVSRYMWFNDIVKVETVQHTHKKSE
jgi:N-acetylglucosaminylphosphatidylinositol deacetylase